jgi:hypothetical protein
MADSLAKAFTKTEASNWLGAATGFVTGTGYATTTGQYHLLGIAPVVGGVIGAIDDRY